MIIGGSSDQLLLAFNPENPTGNHSLEELISLPDSSSDSLFSAVDSEGTTGSIIVGVGLMTANSLVELLGDDATAAVVLMVARLLDPKDELPPCATLSFLKSTSAFFLYVVTEFGLFSGRAISRDKSSGLLE